MTKYFARLDKKTEGPFTLPQLIEAGVRPSTYVWCKGMEDWQKAEDVADVCRAMRFRLAGLPIPGEDPSAVSDAAAGMNAGGEGRPSSAQSSPSWTRLPVYFPASSDAPQPDYDIRPMGISVFYAVLLTILCFPITGAVAIWAAYRFNALWQQSEQPEVSAEERRSLRVRAYEKARIYRMMVGLSISLGIIWATMVMYLQ